MGIKNSEKRSEKSISLVDGKEKDMENLKGCSSTY